MRAMLLGAMAPLLIGAEAAPATLHLILDGLRSSEGDVRICLWHNAAHFPDCRRGQDVRMLSAAAAPTVRIDVGDLRPGSYAVSVIHDENANRRLDKNLVGIPTEGVGFSRNPRLLFGPPRFDAARFDVQGDTEQTIRIKYFL